MNVDIEPDQLAQIHANFAAAGSPEAEIIEPIRSIILTSDWARSANDAEEVSTASALLKMDIVAQTGR